MTRLPRQLTVLGLTAVAIAMLLLSTGIAGSKGIIVPVPQIHTVGNDMACDFSSLQDAIDAAISGDTVRIADQQTNQQLIIDGKSLTLVGGWDDCSDADVPANQHGHLREYITGNGSASVISIYGIGVAGRVNVRLVNLGIRDGGPDASGGGGLDILGAVDVELDHVDVNYNVSTLGGGIRIRGALRPTLRLEGGTSIGGGYYSFPEVLDTEPVIGFYLNEATGNGGGIHCTNADIVMAGASIGKNRTEGSGGGVYLSNCTLSTEAAAVGKENRNQIGRNAATLLVGDGLADQRAGGGILARDGSQVDLRWHGTRFELVANYSEDLGGGAAVTGAGTTLAMYGARIDHNSSGRDGGGVAVSGGASFAMRRSALFGDPGCGGAVLCNSLNDNHAADEGGALYGYSSFDDVNINVRGSFIERNSAVYGAVFEGEADGGPIHLDLISDQLRGNIAAGSGITPGALVDFRGDQLTANSRVTARLGYLSVSDNASETILYLNEDWDLKLYHSILWQPGDWAIQQNAGAVGVTELLCLNVSDPISVPVGTDAVPNWTPLDPDPEVSTSLPLRLLPSSHNVDACVTPGVGKPSDVYDAAGRPRVVDLPGGQSHDRGAFEFNPVDDEPEVFSDSFE